MSRTVLASLFTVLVATSAAPASAQVNFYDPGTWFGAPVRSDCRTGYMPRPMPYRYPRPVFGCPEGICGPVNRYPVSNDCPDGRCGTMPPRAPYPPVLYNQWRAPQPSGGFYESRRPVQDDRGVPFNDDWTARREPQPRRSYDSIRSPFYP